MNRSSSLLVLLALFVAGLSWFLISGPTQDDLNAVESTAPGPPQEAVTPADNSSSLGIDGVVPSLNLPIRATEEETGSREAKQSDSPFAGRGRFLRMVLDEEEIPLAETELELRLLGQEQADENGASFATILEYQRATTSTEGLLDLSEAVEQLAGKDFSGLLIDPYARAELEFRPRTIPAAKLGRTPAGAFEVRVFKRPMAPIKGRVVHPTSGDPLPQVALRFQRWFDLQDPDLPLEQAYIGGSYRVQTQFYDGPSGEWVISDDAGCFVTEGSYPAGRVGFLTIDQERADGQHRLTPAGEALETVLEAPIGPLILLDFDLPPGLAFTDFIAGLWRAPEELMRQDGLQEHPSPWSEDKGALAGLWGNAMPVHGFSPAWVRLSLQQVEEVPLPSRIFVASRDGKAFGHAAVTGFAPYAHRPLRIELEQRPALAGTLVWPTAANEFHNARLSLTGLSPAPEDNQIFLAERWPFRMGREAETPFLFRLVPPGDYSLKVAVEKALPQTIPVQVPTTQPLRIVLEPAPLEEGFDLEVRLVTTSGLALDGEQGRAKLADVFFYSPAGIAVKTSKLTWTKGVGTLQLTGFSPGTYFLYPRWSRGGFEFPHAGQAIELPLSDNTGTWNLTIDDEVATQQFEIRVIDPPAEGRIDLQVFGTGHSISNLMKQFWAKGEKSKGNVTLDDGRRAAVFRLGPYPLSAEPSVSLWMEDYKRPTYTGANFGPIDESGTRTLEIVPQKGWSADIHVYGVRDGQRVDAIGGVVLSFDGVATNQSGEDGSIYAEADRPPTHIAVLTPGWRLVDRSSWNEWGSVIAADGSFTVEDGRLTVHLEAQ